MKGQEAAKGMAGGERGGWEKWLKVSMEKQGWEGTQWHEVDEGIVEGLKETESGRRVTGGKGDGREREKTIMESSKRWIRKWRNMSSTWKDVKGKKKGSEGWKTKYEKGKWRWISRSGWLERGESRGMKTGWEEGRGKRLTCVCNVPFVFHGSIRSLDKVFCIDPLLHAPKPPVAPPGRCGTAVGGTVTKDTCYQPWPSPAFTWRTKWCTWLSCHLQGVFMHCILLKCFGLHYYTFLGDANLWCEDMLKTHYLGKTVI